MLTNRPIRGQICLWIHQSSTLEKPNNLLGNGEITKHNIMFKPQQYYSKYLTKITRPVRKKRIHNGEKSQSMKHPERGAWQTHWYSLWLDPWTCGFKPHTGCRHYLKIKPEKPKTQTLRRRWWKQKVWAFPQPFQHRIALKREQEEPTPQPSVHTDNGFSTRVQGQFNKERVVLSADSARTSGYPLTKEWSWVLCHSMYKM